MPKQAKLSETEIKDALGKVPAWKLLNSGEIERTFDFASRGGFVGVINFVAADIARIAEEINHHPDIDIRYNKVTCRVITHDSGGLTALDFQLAGQLDGDFDLTPMS